LPIGLEFSPNYNVNQKLDTTVTDADDYAELFDAEVRRVLDIHAPLRTGRRRCGQRDIRQLSDEARQAKQLRRRLVRRYRRTGLESELKPMSPSSFPGFNLQTANSTSSQLTEQ